MAYRSFEDLDVWKAACQLAVDVYEIFKNSRDYAMRDQILRSSLSIPSNIAEGMERNSAKDSSRFLHIAKGSAAEIRTQLYLSTRMEMISAAQSSPLLTKAKKSPPNSKRSSIPCNQSSENSAHLIRNLSREKLNT